MNKIDLKSRVKSKMEKIIFIIGGAGYIGSHMVKAASLANYKTITIDNLSTGHADAVLYGKLEICDIRNKSKLDLLFKKYRPEAVVHFGAYSIVGESVEDPLKYYDNNFYGTLKLLEVMIENNCRNIIFSSTAAVFGNPEYLPIDEDHIKEPINPYGQSKLMVENILKDFSRAYELNYIVFRYFNAVGHDKEAGLEERHDPETHLFPIIMQIIKGQRKNLTIYGADYDTDDGTCIRDYIHVEDLCIAHLKGLEALLGNSNTIISDDYNLGNGIGFSVKEVITEFKRQTKVDFDVKQGKRREGDPDVLIASNEKASIKLGYSPTKSDLREIIKSLI